MLAPRLVLVSRPSEYDSLLVAWGSRGQVDFFLRSRGRSLEEVDAAHAAQASALHAVSQATPARWRRSAVPRADLDRFLFAPEDIVVAVGPDGLVANVAKYLDAQPLIGLNPDPARVDGVLMRHSPAQAAGLLQAAAAGRLPLERRTLVEAKTDDGQRLVALNEVFIGHRSHQSARYELRVGGARERQSSSGLIVSTGTGASGWARSIHRATGSALTLPGPCDPQLAYFVREAWPSRHTGVGLSQGLIQDGEALELSCELSEGGVVFGDGLEGDRLELRWGQTLSVRRASRCLHLAA